ncbi:hypothetical protein ACQ5SO_06170 [Rhodovulum sp. DZ06]|uniref:hypothetical protein n=1 Tax=Rhodovulum sp. DZ06 TaxID=3425126 RepID=UPI003D327F70
MPDQDRAAIALRFSNTHLYKGARGAGPLPRRAEGAVPCMVEFSDGGAGFGTVARSGPNRWRLSMQAHVTAKGARIDAKTWALEKEGAAEGLPSAALKVVDRLG